MSETAPVVVPSDLVLVERFQSGDPSAFQLLFQRYYRLVRVAIWNYVRRKDAIEDLCQEIFLKAYRQLPRLKEGKAFKAWLLRIACSTSIDAGRRRQVQETSFDPDVHADVPASPEPSIETQGDGLILRALEKLSPMDGMIVWLHYVEELSFLEVGEIVGLVDNTVRQRAFRALQSLRKDIP